MSMIILRIISSFVEKKNRFTTRIIFDHSLHVLILFEKTKMR